MYCYNCGTIIPNNAKYCTECGSRVLAKQPSNGNSVDTTFVTSTLIEKNTPPMSVWKIISGIIAFVISGFIAFEISTIVPVAVNSDLKNAVVAGMLVMLLLIICGIISIVARKNRFSNIIIIIISIIGAFLGFVKHGIFKDLIIWSSWFVVMSIVDAICFAAWNDIKNE